jgi:hypothetical protein
MDWVEELALTYKCEYCTASPGAWCRTGKGAKATALHGCRTSALYSAFGLGYQEGAASHKTVGTVTYQSNWPPNQSSTGVAG